jgi:hypothetical protein
MRPVHAARDAGTVTAIAVSFPAPGITAAGPTGARTIGGTVVPWGVPGQVADGRTVVFEPGSIDAAARPVMLRDHDRARPIGQVVDATDDGAGIDATGRLAPNVPDANDVLALAADHVPLMFSVGATPSDAAYDDAGVLHVYAASWDELSVLTFGAFGSAAAVSRVTASQPRRTTMPPDADPVTVLDADPDPPDDDDTRDDADTEPNPDIEPDVPAPADAAPVTAGRVPLARRPGRRAAPARHPYADVGLSDVCRLITAAAASGDPRTVAQVQRIMASPGARTFPIDSPIAAALTDVTLVGTNNVGPAYRPAYQAELVDIVSHGSPVVDSLRQGDLQRGDYPNVTFNQWTKVPEVALQSAEKVAINSVPVQITPTAVPVQTWTTGNDLSQQLLDFGSPSFVEDYVRAAGVDYAEVIDVYAITTLMAGGVNVPTVLGDGLTDVLGKLFAGLDPTKVPAGRMVAVVSWDLGVGAMGVVGSDNQPVFWQGSISFGSFMPNVEMGGLTIIVDPNMPAKSAMLYLSNAATWYDLPGTPFSLRAINVGQLGLDVAVYGYGACGLQYPGAITHTTVPDV